MPISSAGDRAEGQRAARSSSSAARLDEQRPRPGRAGSAAASRPNTGPTISDDDAAHDEEERDRAERAAAADPQARATTSADAAANAISIGWKTNWNCGTPKSNSAWKVDRPIRKPPGERRAAAASAAPARRVGARSAAARWARAPSTSSTPWPISDSRRRRSASGASGPRASRPGRTAGARRRRAGSRSARTPPHASISDAAERRVPVARRCRIARRAGLLLGSDDREEAGGEDAEQAEQDQVVGRVGERARGRGRGRCAGRCPSTCRAAR